MFELEFFLALVQKTTTNFGYTVSRVSSSYPQKVDSINMKNLH